MDESVLNQARTIHRTVRLLQERLIHRFNALQKDQGFAHTCADFTFPQYNAMLVIQEQGELSIKTLAEHLRVSSPSASSMVDRLVEMGMLEREQSQSDRRTVVVRMSAEGRANLEALDTQMLEALGYFLEALGREGAQSWCAIYERIAEIICLEEAAEPEVLSQEQSV
ncbi:MAG: MarR family transcriptional regulator [Candidatus Hydrogenedentes bacterium]|nr:MarR family transcriptional regulator [Candidatus Hydrogenedentota bacterium]